MRKHSTPILLLLFLFTTALWGQERQYEAKPVRASSFNGFLQQELEARGAIDTLLPEAYKETCGFQLTSFGVTGQWGFVGGMNGLGDKEKAQLVNNTTNTTIKINAVWALFDFATVVNNGNLRVKVYSTGNGNLPDVVLGQSNDLKVDEIRVDPNAILTTVFPFSTPLSLDNASFILSADFTDLYATQDTVGLLQTELGCGSGQDAFELWVDNTWHSLREAWSSDTEDFDSSLPLFAVVEFEDPNAVNDPFVQQNGLRIFPAAPNPARNTVRLGYALEKSSTVQIEIYSIDGRRLQHLRLGQRGSGEHVEEVDLSNYADGPYVYSIVTQEARIMSRFVVK